MESTSLGLHDAFQARMYDVHRASRSAGRRAASVRLTIPRTDPHRTVLVAARAARLAVFAAARETALVRPVVRLRSVPAVRTGPVRHAAPDCPVIQHRHVLARRPAVQHRRTYRVVVTRHAEVFRSSRRVELRGGMSAVIAYARSQVGRRYVSGGTGGSGFDCSGLTQQAYARAGIALPHSSWAQAAKARGISRRYARPGDLVVGPGHVGIYMGHGMMIDAGNHRTGVVYRKLFSGLSVERL